MRRETRRELGYVAAIAIVSAWSYWMGMIAGEGKWRQRFELLQADFASSAEFNLSAAKGQRIALDRGDLDAARLFNDRLSSWAVEDFNRLGIACCPPTREEDIDAGLGR